MSSGSILRGHLRPVGARGPPFLIILLLVIILILGFNYWNLSAEYDTLLKETADLQDHLRLAVLKKETADRQYEAFEKRYRESEAQLGKLKLAADQKDHEISKISENLDQKIEENKQLKSQLTSCQAINAKLEMNTGMIEELQKKTSQLEEQKNSLNQDNRKMLKTINSLRFKIEEMEFHHSNAQIIPQAQPNPFLTRSKIQNGTINQDEAAIKILNSTVQNKKMDISNNANNLENNHIAIPEVNRPVEVNKSEVNRLEGENIEQKPDENKIPVGDPENETTSEAAEGMEKMENNNVVESKNPNATNTVKTKADVISNQEEKNFNMDGSMLKNNPEYNEVESQNLKLNGTENLSKANEVNNAQKEENAQIVKQAGEISPSPDLNDIPKV